MNDQKVADEFLRLACLSYSADDRARPIQAAALLAERPDIAGFSVHVMAALGDHAAVAMAIAIDHTSATVRGGPFDWEPLLYTAYSRLTPEGQRFDAVATAHVLLQAGADPNAGYLWDGLYPPFTALTGAFGCGEGGQPAHPRSIELARMLLQAGADPNDGQTIYNKGLGNAQLRDDTEWLALLYEYGFGTPQDGPWCRQLGDALQSPTDLVAEVLHHSARMGLVNRTRLVLDHGSDPNRPGRHPAFRDRTPYQDAVANGHREPAQLLVNAGADTTRIDVHTRFLGAMVSGDQRLVEAMLNTQPGLMPTMRSGHPGLIRKAAELGHHQAIDMLVGYGFDVNHHDQATALHEAALRNDRAMVDLLLRHGGDLAIVDHDNNSTPAGWAEWAGHHELARHLTLLHPSTEDPAQETS